MIRHSGCLVGPAMAMHDRWPAGSSLHAVPTFLADLPVCRLLMLSTTSGCLLTVPGCRRSPKAIDPTCPEPENEKRSAQKKNPEESGWLVLGLDVCGRHHITESTRTEREERHKQETMTKTKTAANMATASSRACSRPMSCHPSARRARAATKTTARTPCGRVDRRFVSVCLHLELT